MRSCALSGPVVVHRFPQQVFVYCAENLIGEFQGAHFLACQINYVNLCHISLESLVTSYFFPLAAAALFAAFNGSTVVAPANPRRSRGGCLAFWITMYPPFGPGTAPSTINRFSSRSMPMMRRLRTVTLSTPI